MTFSLEGKLSFYSYKCIEVILICILPRMFNESQQKCENSHFSRLIRRFLSHETRSELSAIVGLAWPVGVLSLFQFLLQFITVLFCGHLGQNVLAGVSLAASYVNVTAIVLGTGFGTAIDTLASQSFGANNKRRVGIILQQSLLIFTAVCFPVWGIWLNTEKLSEMIVSDKSSAKVAGEFMDVFLPALPAIFLFIILSKYLENQQIVRPMLITGIFSCAMSVVYNGLLVYAVELGVPGIAIAGVLGNYTLAFSTLGVILLLKLHKDTWKGWSRECLFEWGLFCKLAFSGLVMLVAIWGSFQAGTFLVAVISNADLSAFAITFQVLSLPVCWPMGISVAASVRVGIFLGQGRHEKAKFSANLCIHLTWISAILCGVLFVAMRKLIGQAFTSDQAVIDLLSKEFLIYFGWIILFDWLQTVLQGVVRGCGDQKAGAVVSVIAFFIAVPIGTCLTFLTSLGSVGYWLGLGVSAIFQAVAYYIQMYRTNWKDQSFRARKRSGVVFDDVRAIVQKPLWVLEENQPLLQREVVQSNYSSVPLETSENKTRRISSSSSSISISERAAVTNSIEESVKTIQSSSSRRDSIVRFSSSVSRPISDSVGSFQNLTENVSSPVFISWKILLSRLAVFIVSILLFFVGLTIRLLSG